MWVIKKTTIIRVLWTMRRNITENDLLLSRHYRLETAAGHGEIRRCTSPTTISKGGFSRAYFRHTPHAWRPPFKNARCRCRRRRLRQRRRSAWFYRVGCRCSGTPANVIVVGFGVVSANWFRSPFGDTLARPSSNCGNLSRNGPSNESSWYKKQ